MKPGNRAAVLEFEVRVLLGHCNTLAGCCTSFVNLGADQVAVGGQQVPQDLSFGALLDLP
jgi:hypothetical protein